MIWRCSFCDSVSVYIISAILRAKRSHTTITARSLTQWHTDEYTKMCVSETVLLCYEWMAPLEARKLMSGIFPNALQEYKDKSKGINDIV